MKVCFFSLATLIVLLLSLGGGEVTREMERAKPISAADLSSSPVRFIENVGQFDARARFQGQGGSTTFWLTKNGLWLTRVETLSASDEPDQAESRRAVNLKLSFVGANPHPRLEPFNRQESVAHYYYGPDPAG